MENTDWQVETSDDLSAGSWTTLPTCNLHPWRDHGDATEYPAVPPVTESTRLFGRMVVMGN